MQRVQADPHIQRAAELIREARSLLQRAVDLARRANTPQLFDYLVSYGNTWKTPPDEDLDKALKIYGAAANCKADMDQRAKLWKVQADALVARGNAEDVRLAEQLIEHSIKSRRGTLQIESLGTAAKVALAHPDLGDAAREGRAANLLMEAIRIDHEYARPCLDGLLHLLASWQQLSSEARGPAEMREELKEKYPDLATKIDAKIIMPTPQERKSLLELFRHPASKVLMEIRIRLMHVGEHVDPYDFLKRVPTALRAEAEAHAAQLSIAGQPDRMESWLSRLAASPNDASYPGVLAGRVVLLAELARLGRRKVAEVRKATTEAVDSLAKLDNLTVRALLLREVAQIWCPSRHVDDPVCDFSFATGLLRECLALEGGEKTAMSDTLAALARALRYSPTGDQQSNLQQARRLFGLRLEHARKSEADVMIAGALSNLAEIESQLATGDRLAQLRSSVALLEEAVSLASAAPAQQAKYLANLAWEMTRLGALLRGQEGKQRLELALNTFSRIDMQLLEPHGRENTEDNRSTCTALFARLTRGRAAEIEAYRKQLGVLKKSDSPYRIATAKHNLANALMFGKGVTGGELREGLQLSHEALSVRTMQVNPRHHWETAIGAGHAIIDALKSEDPNLIGVSMSRMAAEARDWLRRALAAARILGSGEEVIEAAFALCELGTGAPSRATMLDHIDEAWVAVRQAAAYLLLNPHRREEEAWRAMNAAARLAYHWAQDDSLSIPIPYLKFILQGDKAQHVALWFLRGQQPTRRLLRARLAHPQDISASLKARWLEALRTRDRRGVADTLDEIKKTNSDYLDEDVVNEATWSWLEAHPGGVAVSFALAKPTSLALVMQSDAGRQRRTWVLGLDAPPPPSPLEDLPKLLAKATSESEAAVLSQTAAWLRNHMAVPIEKFLSARPSTVLWNPGPNLRFIPPREVWGEVPVAMSASFALPDLSLAPTRARSTLLMLADPGDLHSPHQKLGRHGMSAFEELAKAASNLGPVTLMASVGAHFGSTLLGAAPHALETPASAAGVVEAVEGHETIVLIAHGEAETPEEASLLCLDSRGQIDRLGVAQIEGTPERFTGARILLLSCSSGRVGDGLADPGGLAGTLISAGARCVVAPLWPVQLDIAAQVGRAVLEGLAVGEEPWDVLARLPIRNIESSPVLGRPPPSPASQLQAQTLQRMAFVCWVG